MPTDQGSSAGNPGAAAVTARQEQLVERSLGEWREQPQGRLGPQQNCVGGATQ